jgi:hypothetical protein
MIKFKTTNFKTIFIRYRAKKDGNLIKEINDMNLNLSDSGTELMANAKEINKIIDEALKKFSNEVDKVSVNDSNVY